MDQGMQFDCPKHPGHKDFIPFYKFSPSHLKDVYQDLKLYGLIESQANLTVKVKCRLRKNDEVELLQKCSGFIIWIEKVKANKPLCHCNSCRIANSSIYDEWYELVIVTQRSVLNDQDQTENGEVEFCLCHHNHYQEISKKLKGHCKYVKINEDICQLHFSMYDSHLGLELYRHFAQFKKQLPKAWCLMKGEPNDMLSISVSHLHGFEKCISLNFEKIADNQPTESKANLSKTRVKTDPIQHNDIFSKPCDHDDDDPANSNFGNLFWPPWWNFSRVSYTVPTCSGSVGAIILCLTQYHGFVLILHQGQGQIVTEDDQVKTLRYFLKKDKRQDPLPYETNIVPPSLPPTAFPKVQFGETETEAHQTLLWTECEKEPGHEKCICMNELRKDHLPQGCNDHIYLDYIMCTSSLTVKVKSSLVRSHRPSAHPFTGDVYKFSDMVGEFCHHNTTGFVIHTRLIEFKNGQQCHCETCIKSEEKRYHCYQINIMKQLMECLIRLKLTKLKLNSGKLKEVKFSKL